MRCVTRFIQSIMISVSTDLISFTGGVLCWPFGMSPKVLSPSCHVTVIRVAQLSCDLEPSRPVGDSRCPSANAFACNATQLIVTLLAFIQVQLQI